MFLRIEKFYGKFELPWLRSMAEMVDGFMFETGLKLKKTMQSYPVGYSPN